jgi:hypothetical protein
LRPLLRGNFRIVIAHGVERLRRPTALTEFCADGLGSTGIFRLKRLIHELANGEIRTLHEEPLELNDDLNHAVGFGTSLGRKNAGILQRGQ